MSELELLLGTHGVWLLALVVAVDQLGIPIPAPPALVVAGGLVGTGDLPGMGVVLAGTAAALLGSLVWFMLGRRLGAGILGLLCRISLEPDSCVRSTRARFERRGPKTLLFARFVPGMQTVAPPLSGMSGMTMARFLAWDGPGALLWVVGYVVLGALLHEQVDLFLELLASFGAWLGVVLVGGLGLWILGKVVQRQRFLRSLRMARISPEQLREQIEQGEAPAIFDLRLPAEVEREGLTIPGAHWIGLDQLDVRHPEIPRDREIVLFCSCPNEASAAQVAFQLKRRGVERVRPLAGGLTAWREAGHPVETLARESIASAAADASATRGT